MAEIIELYGKEVICVCPFCRGKDWHLISDTTNATPRNIIAFECADPDCDFRAELTDDEDAVSDGKKM
jgi:hypothetical protein